MDAIKQMPQVDPVEFALALHRRLAKGDAPVLLSPVSVSLALRPLMLGARGETAAGIARVLAGGKERSDGATTDRAIRIAFSSPMARPCPWQSACGWISSLWSIPHTQKS